MSVKMAKMDLGIFICTLLMIGFGIILVYSSSFPVAQQKFGGADFFLARHIVRSLLAIVALMVFMNIDYHVWGNFSKPLFWAAVAMLIAVMVLPGSHAVNGARRWISLGFIQFQASEFARMALIVIFAAQCGDESSDIRTWQKFCAQLIKLGIICSLVIIEPDFGTALIIGLIGISMLFIAGAKIGHLLGLGAALIPIAGLVLLSAPYRRQRVMAFLNMADFKNSAGYQTYQSIMGLGHGGIFGVGLGQAESKYFYLPEAHTDFAFSILGEEIGFIGAMAVFAIFAFMIWRGMRIALNAPDKMGQLIAFGITFMMSLYLIFHTCVNTGLIPTKGVPMPFLSYGGMSLVFTVSGMGMLLNISSQARISQPKRYSPATVSLKRIHAEN